MNIIQVIKLMASIMAETGMTSRRIVDIFAESGWLPERKITPDEARKIVKTTNFNYEDIGKIYYLPLRKDN